MLLASGMKINAERNPENPRAVSRYESNGADCNGGR